MDILKKATLGLYMKVSKQFTYFHLQPKDAGMKN